MYCSIIGKNCNYGLLSDFHNSDWLVDRHGAELSELEFASSQRSVDAGKDHVANLGYLDYLCAGRCNMRKQRTKSKFKRRLAQLFMAGLFAFGAYQVPMFAWRWLWDWLIESGKLVVLGK